MHRNLRVYVTRTCVSTLACSMRVLESAERPLLAHAMCESISAILSMLRGSCVANKVSLLSAI